MDRQPLESALQSANIALTGKRNRETSRFASIELRTVDARTGAWEVAAATCVAFATLIFVLGMWFY